MDKLLSVLLSGLMVLSSIPASAILDDFESTDDDEKPEYTSRPLGWELLVAAANGDLPRVRQFVEEFKVDINYSEEYGVTALHFALLNHNVHKGQCEVAAYLIKRQAQQDIPAGLRKMTARQFIELGCCAQVLARQAEAESNQ